MKENFESSLRKLLAHEGGFVNHPLDPGGATNLGVTKAAWEEWVGRSSSIDEIKALTPEKVAPFYKRKYWDRVCGDELPSGVDYAVFDAAVNSGPGRAVKWLQQSLGVTVDGALGPKTLKAAKEADAKFLVVVYNAIRLAFLEDLPTWGVFGRGWGRRVAEVRDVASTMVA